MTIKLLTPTLHIDCEKSESIKTFFRSTSNLKSGICPWLYALRTTEKINHPFVNNFPFHNSMAQETKADIGIVGLAVMGQNLILNFNDHGYTVCAYNRTISKVDEFLSKEAKGTKVIGTHSIEELVRNLKKPRKIMLMIKAGAPVDEFIKMVVPFLDNGDIIIDGGNSLYTDTERRVKELGKLGILFVGCGVSGGEDGARYGPSLMPGGAEAAWPALCEMFQAIAAKANQSSPCCEWVGGGGAGHFVKMVHNGIEYGDMQLIGEAYHLMRDGLRLSHEQMSAVFSKWNQKELNSFLIDITSKILKVKDCKGDAEKYLVANIRDAAGQKGTGKWTVEAALQMGTPVTLVSEAVFARSLSAMKNERVYASKLLPGPNAKFAGNTSEMLESLKNALYAAKIISYAQGFMLFKQAALTHGWTLNNGAIAMMWRGGCIIQSAFLDDIKNAFDKNSDLENLLFDPFFCSALEKCQNSWRRVIIEAIMLGIPMPAMSTALAFYDGLRSELLPANLLQAQRDYFGAHTFEYLDQPGVFHHYNWTGQGGSTSSTTYNV